MNRNRAPGIRSAHLTKGDGGREIIRTAFGVDAAADGLRGVWVLSFVGKSGDERLAKLSFPENGAIGLSE